MSHRYLGRATLRVQYLYVAGAIYTTSSHATVHYHTQFWQHTFPSSNIYVRLPNLPFLPLFFPSSPSLQSLLCSSRSPTFPRECVGSLGAPFSANPATECSGICHILFQLLHLVSFGPRICPQTNLSIQLYPQHSTNTGLVFGKRVWGHWPSQTILTECLRVIGVL